MKVDKRSVIYANGSVKYTMETTLYTEDRCARAAFIHSFMQRLLINIQFRATST